MTSSAVKILALDKLKIECARFSNSAQLSIFQLNLRTHVLFFLSLCYISTLLGLFQLDFRKFSAVVDLQRAERRHLGTDALGKLSPELFAEKKCPGNKNSDFPLELENLKTNRWRHFNVGGSVHWSTTNPPQNVSSS